MSTECDQGDHQGGDQDDLKCMRCQHPNYDFQATITEHIGHNGGCAIIPVFDSGFVYTVGLKESFGCAEFIMAGAFDVNQMCEAITGAVDELKTNRAAFDDEEVPGIIKVIDAAGAVVDGTIGCRTVAKNVRAAMMCKAADRYGEDGFEGKQLIFPDTAGKLPWQQGFDKAWGGCQATLYDFNENGK